MFLGKKLNIYSSFTNLFTKRKQNFPNKNLYVLSDGNWSVQTTIPFNYYYFYDGSYYGFTVDNTIVILSAVNSYSYNLGTNTWEKRALLPHAFGTNIIVGTEMNGKAYLLTNSGTICEYDPKTNEWKLITEYVKYLNDKICAFSYKNKLYFGLGLKQNTESELDPDRTTNWVDNELWSYDLTTNKRELACILPVDLHFGNFFSFRIKDNFYFGNRNTTFYDIYKLDMSKLK